LLSYYRLIVYAHILAAIFFTGYLLFWVTTVGPIGKRLDRIRGARIIDEMRLKFSGLGWSALAVLVLTGSYLTSHRIGGFGELLSWQFFSTSFGQLLGVKLFLVLVLLIHEMFIGAKAAVVRIGFTCALLVVGLSVLIVRNPGLAF